jgi:hypothetical protein
MATGVGAGGSPGAGAAQGSNIATAQGAVPASADGRAAGAQAGGGAGGAQTMGGGSSILGSTRSPQVASPGSNAPGTTTDAGVTAVPGSAAAAGAGRSVGCDTAKRAVQARLAVLRQSTNLESLLAMAAPALAAWRPQ